jgi:hypothetical protein
MNTCVRRSTGKLRLLIGLAFAALAAIEAAGQAPAQSKLPSAPEPGAGAYNSYIREGLTCGGGASTSDATTKPMFQCGGLVDLLPFVDLEGGAMGPQANRGNVSGYLSGNLWAPLMNPKYANRLHGLPLAVGGYTYIFGTGHALDYGIAFARTLDDSHSLQFEVRDYWAFEKPGEHNIVLRVVWLSALQD